MLDARQVLEPGSRAKQEEALIETLGLKEAGIEDALAGLELLRRWGSGKDVREKYVEQAKGRWTEASVFKV